MRAAFAATLEDPEFRADAVRIGLAIDPLTGEELAKRIDRFLATPKDLVAKADAARQP